MIAISADEQNATLRMENRNLRDANKHLQGELVRARARVVDPALYELLGAMEAVVEDCRGPHPVDPNLSELVRCWDAWHGPSP